MAELQKVDDWLSALLANLEPAARSRMMRQLAQELRRAQQQNIRMQRNPDGSSYEPRRVTARSKKGRIKRQMFTKLRTKKYLKTAASTDSASVQFEGKVQRLSLIHISCQIGMAGFFAAAGFVGRAFATGGGCATDCHE